MEASATTMTTATIATTAATATTRPTLPPPPRPSSKPTPRKQHNRKGSLKNAANKDSTENIRARARATRKNGSGGPLSPTDSSSGDAPARGGKGREFIVGNVGNNGMIYLRPVIRPASERQRPAPPPFTFPVEPPSAATGIDIDGKANNDFDGSYFTGSRPTTATPTSKRAHKVSQDDSQLPAMPPLEALTHLRSRSFSNDNEPVQKDGMDNNGNFKVIIHRPSVRRPRTADSGALPMLEVPIPHYRLGTPQFNSLGVPILRSSAYTRTSFTEDRASNVSRTANDRQYSFMSSGKARHSAVAGIPSHSLSAVPRRRRTDHQSSPDQYDSQEPMMIPPSGLVDTRIYDYLAKNPDDPMVVRYAPGTKDIVAASPARLIAYITSSDFLDYELLSDFFLTFRSYLGPTELAAYLIARLRWSVEGTHDSGRIVRVRTFVAIRHWILNYFIDDFLPDFNLRIAFSTMVNELHRDLRARQDHGGHDAKIITELKKCWRRTCGLFWDDLDPFHLDRPDADILPGGQLGSRESEYDHLAHDHVSAAPSFQGHSRNPGSKDTGRPTATTLSTAARSHAPQQSVASVAYTKDSTAVPPTSPTSEGSVQAISCSFPKRGSNRVEAGSSVRLYPHPAPPGHRRNVSASNPSRPRGDHKRSGSFSDALRDTRPPHSPVKPPMEIEQQPIMLPMPGSLVRGVLVQPESPYFECDLSNSPKPLPLHTNFHAVSAPTSPQDKSPSLANPGVKRLLGSVRRVLGTRPEHHLGRPAIRHDVDGLGMGNKINLSNMPGPRFRSKGANPQIRMDLLASNVYQSFNLAVMAETGQDALGRTFVGHHDIMPYELDNIYHEPVLPYKVNDASRLNSNFTTGSRSIVIVDDTGSAELYLMSGALPSRRKDVDLHPPLPMSAPPTTRHFDHLVAQSHVRNFSLDEVLASSDPPNFPHNEPPYYPMQAALQDHRAPSSAASDHTVTDRGASIASSRTADTAVLRRFASFHSGMSRNTQARAPSSGAPSSHDDPFYLERPPARQLRRRPAADLRAVNHAQDDEPIPRPRSAEAYPGHMSSSSPTTDSVLSGSRRAMSPSVHSRPRDTHQTVPKIPKSISLVDTHSSEPNLRPSFQAEVAKLAALPDEEDDGGIDATLLKLEGRYEKRPTPEGSERNSASHPSEENSGQVDIAKLHAALIATPQVQAQDPLQSIDSSRGMLSPGAEISPKQLTTKSMQSEDSYSSVPLLERGLSSNAIPTRMPRNVDSIHEERSIPSLLSPKTSAAYSVAQTGPLDASGEHVPKKDSMLQVPRNGSIPVGIVAHHSFLLNDDQDLSDASEDSKDCSDGKDRLSQDVHSFYDDMDEEYPAHPLRHSSTPALVVDNSDTPRATLQPPRLNQPGSHLGSPIESSSILPSSPPLHRSPPPAVPQYSAEPFPPRRVNHLPFILTYDAEFLAQQFTIIEKDALDEIDWKELIELRWKHSLPPVYDWVEYLRTQEPRGVDIVIARFNLMTKWALSEIVLCENANERLQCIIQYIRIASHARKLRNYATMYQITLALVSSDCTRLKKTWAQVPAAERGMMRELEALVQPVRNFYNLRLEMETAHTDGGCIPFIGIYTRDLVYNAQKPAYITSPPNSDHPLVNFERHHTAATIVKSLLRLLESSTRYEFQADPSTLSKCLWMAALEDEEIAILSRKLE